MVWSGLLFSITRSYRRVTAQGGAGWRRERGRGRRGQWRVDLGWRRVGGGLDDSHPKTSSRKWKASEPPLAMATRSSGRSNDA